MRIARLLLLAALAAAVLMVSSAGAAPPAPTGLHGFLLRADEPAQQGDSFPRTPAFAWDPVPGAVGYEFQLSTSKVFNDGDSASDNSIFYDTNSLTSPVAAPPLVLPWITGSPHALFARVRATTPDGVGPWSASYGFDLGPNPAYPTPLSTQGDPGLLRWTPIEGADAYQIWLVDLPNGGKIVKTRTNVLDEREFYTFHGSQQWIGSVRWRVRAVRSIEGGTPANHFPVSSYGKWSPIYKSTNPALATGPLHLVNTISDVVEAGTGSHDEPAHKLMPAFTWAGDTVTLPNGSTVTTELFRVEVFSDRACLNMVYAGPIVGGQSWAPRAFGGSPRLPDPNNLGFARANFPSDGGQGASLTYDGTAISSAEDLSPAAPTATAPPDAIPAGASQAVTSPPDTATFPPVAGTASVGAPVDLWDTNWPGSGYYWTVMPVAPALSTSSGTVAAPGASKGSAIVPVTDTSHFVPNEIVTIGTAPNSDTATVVGVGNGLLTLSTALNFGHVPGDPVVVLGGASQYEDVMLAEDLCQAANMRHELGIWSEPTVAAPNAPFATGLSADGKLISATSDSQFYGHTLVAWTPALRAEKYEVEWSKTDKPFVAVGNLLTTSTAAVLPVGTGTWYYRIRGFDYNLPTGSQQMAWSDIQSIDVAQPTFKIVGSTKSVAPKKTAAPKARAKQASWLKVSTSGFSLAFPKTWKRWTNSLASSPSITYEDPTGLVKLTALQDKPRGTATWAAWTTQLSAQIQPLFGTATPATSTVTLGGRRAVLLTDSGPFVADHVQRALRAWDVDAGTHSYLLEFMTLGNETAAQRALMARIASTFTAGK